MTRIGANPVEIVEKELSFLIVKAFFEVYKELGFGFLEQIYSRALEIVLRRMGLHVEREVPVAVIFEGQQIGFHRLDMLVEGKVAIEIKTNETVANASHQQLRNYLAALRLDEKPIKLGILLHFGPKPRYYRHLPSSSIRVDSRHSSHSVIQPSGPGATDLMV